MEKLSEDQPHVPPAEIRASSKEGGRSVMTDREHTLEPGLGRPDGPQLAEISNAVVRLQKEFFGKGPTKARTTWAGEDALVCMLGGGFTPVEQTLYESGREDAVQAMRYAFQMAMKERLSAAIEKVVERKVVAFMSASHQHPDISCEIFVLEPRPDDEDSPVGAENRQSPAEL
jgi:uncharacterized protein YbcI